MAYGTLPNIANAGHEPTPDERAEQITRNLLKLPRGHFTVLDGTCDEGNLLAPFQDNAHAELIGIEINGKWAELAGQRLPQARIITAAVEHVSIAPSSISLATLNPPYLVTNGGRMELQVFRQMCDAVQPHGVIYSIICQSPRYTTERSSAIVQKYRRHECNHLRAPYPNRLSYVQSQSLAARRIYGWKENPTDGYPQSAAPFAGHYQSE